MQAAKFGHWLHTIATYNRALGADRAAQIWSKIADAFIERGDETVSTVLKPLQKAELAARADQLSLAAIAPQLGGLGNALEAAAPAPLRVAYDKLCVEIERHRSASIGAFTSAIGADAIPTSALASATAIDVALIDAYSEKLRAASGDEVSFTKVMAEFKEDVAMRSHALVELARAFTGRAGQSGPKSLERIWNRHRKERDVAARRSAA